MGAALSMGDEGTRVPRLAKGWERRSRDLSPAEGFLLSRIDGRTPWTVLREMGGVEATEADACFERWIEAGLVELDGDAPSDGASAQGVDPGLDISVELQREILQAEASLDRTYHELLGVTRSSDAKEIKRAYFALSKKFHPDRYYRQRIGSFKTSLENVFKKLAEAYELLSDPTTRAEIERSLAQAPPPKAAQAAPKPTPTDTAAPKGYPRKLSKRETLERLRNRFRLPESVMAERRLKARNFYESARIAMSQCSWLEAAASTRLAIAFDPWEAEYKRGFAEIQSKVHDVRAGELLKKAEEQETTSPSDALKLYEEVIHYRPGDARAHLRGARLALEVNELEQACEWAEAAADLAPAEFEPRLLLVRALRKAGLRDRALEALAEAEKIDPARPEIASERKALSRPRARR